MECWCRPISGIRCDLGEGLVWDCQANRLFMTDIVNNKVLDIDVETETYQCWGLPEAVGWVLPTKVHSLYVVGLKSGIALFDTKVPEGLHWVNIEFPGNQQCRLNDACTDSTGRIWYGSMNYKDDSAVDGKLASYAINEGLRVHDDGFTVTNGPAVAPNGQSLYFSDTLNSVVYRYALSLIPGKIACREEFIRFRQGQGFPDGMCFDAEDTLWIAMWGAGQVIRVDLMGRILSSINIPALNVTNVCFGGKNLDRMFVSTAAIGMASDVSRGYPNAGMVFEIINHGTKGLPSHPFKET